MKNFYLGFVVVLAATNENCTDTELEARCVADCEEAFTECIIDCGENDPVCVSECSRQSVQCMTLCPCHDNCFDGCPCSFQSQYCSQYWCSLVSFIFTETHTVDTAKASVPTWKTTKPAIIRLKTNFSSVLSFASTLIIYVSRTVPRNTLINLKNAHAWQSVPVNSWVHVN